LFITLTEDGNPYDNAVGERVNGIRKDESGLDDVLADLQQVQKQTDQAISLYNNHRPHLSCSMVTPQQMHSQTKLKSKTWSKKMTRALKLLAIFYLRCNIYKSVNLF
jgi:putative transposase